MVDHPALRAAIIEGLRHLERAGADFLGIACNTAHIYFPDLAASIGVPLLDMVALAADAVPAEVRAPALVAARPTVEAGIYQSALAARGLRLTDPGFQDRVDALLDSVRDDPSPAFLTAAWAGLADTARAAGADALLVACLDLSATLRHAPPTLPVLDAARCLAAGLVRRWREPDR